jgi:hypothetical protein
MTQTGIRAFGRQMPPVDASIKRAAYIQSMMRKILTALVFALTLTTGCSMTHGDPKNPKKNPHPIKRYEVTATTDAPGPWDAVKG